MKKVIDGYQLLYEFSKQPYIQRTWATTVRTFTPDYKIDPKLKQFKLDETLRVIKK